MLDIRPWGLWQKLDEGQGYWIKKITVNPGQKLSLQYHEHRSERWTIIQGVGEVTLNKKKQIVNAGATVIIGKKDIHRIHNVFTVPLIFLEVALGNPLEEDIVRLEDNYGRK